MVKFVQSNQSNHRMCPGLVSPVIKFQVKSVQLSRLLVVKSSPSSPSVKFIFSSVSSRWDQSEFRLINVLQVHSVLLQILKMRKRCVPGAHLVRLAYVNDRVIAAETIVAYKQCALEVAGIQDAPVEPNQVIALCRRCWMIIQQRKERPVQPVFNPNRFNYFQYHIVEVIIGVCFCCGGADPNHQVPLLARVDFFLKMNAFIPQGTRVCRGHLSEDAHAFNISTFTLRRRPFPVVEDVVSMMPDETTRWFRVIRESTVLGRRNMVDHILQLPPDAHRDVLGILPDQMRTLLDLVVGYKDTNGTICQPVSVILLLLKLRQCQYLSFLKSWFRYQTKAAVSLQIRVARKAMMERFVPLHLGPDANPRPESLNHVTQLARSLHLDEQNQTNSVLVIDTTYVYIPKSSNFTILKRSYSQHKGRHLVKMEVIVFPDGRIVDTHGPYFCDSQNNDARILQAEVEKDSQSLRSWLREGDVIVVDRGYRDAVPALKAYGYNVGIPYCAPHGGRDQHPTLESNKSRIITVTRYIVEYVHGHLSQIFKFFGRSIHAGNVPFIKEYFRISCALLNAFYPTVRPRPDADFIANQMLQRRDMSNRLQERLEQLGLLNFRRHTLWRDMEDVELEDFPRMSEDDLFRITLGVYQIRTARGYIEESQDSFLFQVAREQEDILSVRMWSRHRSAADPANRYHVFVQYRAGQNGPDGVCGWYCNCIAGARVVGTCAHVTAILWYLCFARYEPNMRLPSRRNLELILDVAERHHRMNVIDG